MMQCEKLQCPAHHRPLVENRAGHWSFSRLMAPALALLLSCIQVASAHFETADFESSAHGTTTLGLSRVAFQLSGNLQVQDGEVLFGTGARYGSEGSTRWMGTPLGANSGSIGALATAYPTYGFYLQWVQVWASGDSGSTANTGDVTFIGQRHDGETLTHTFTFSPDGPSDTNYALLYLPSEWTTFVLRKVQIVLGTGLNYIALDNLGYSTDALSPCTSRPCGSHGSCYDDWVGGYECRCQNGYVGVHCETNFDDCAPDPCKNGGVCSDRTDDFRCACPAGFEGKRCDINIDECTPAPCLNGGTCFDGIDDYSCNCAPGFTGASCEINIDECAPDPCLNGGICVDSINGYTCSCAPGFKGPQCGCEIRLQGPECNCSDLDGDTCLECPAGADPNVDGPDFDGDGLCDRGDPDADNDGRANPYDWAPVDTSLCSDVDQDGCDDCTSLNFDPLADGPDWNHDGQCDRSDPKPEPTVDAGTDGAMDGAMNGAMDGPWDNGADSGTGTFEADADAGHIVQDAGFPPRQVPEGEQAVAGRSDTQDASLSVLEPLPDSSVPDFSTPQAHQHDVERINAARTGGCSTSPTFASGPLDTLIFLILMQNWFRRRRRA